MGPTGRTSQVVMEPEDVSALRLAATRLKGLLQVSSKFVGERVNPACPGSRMYLATSSGFRDAYDMVEILIQAGEDHLRSMLNVLTIEDKPLPTYSLWTLLRVAAEATVRCRHLLDLSISERDRLARGLNERLDNLLEQRKVIGPAAPDHFDNRVANLVKRATANGITVVREKSDPARKVRGFVEAVPTDTKMFSRYLREGDAAFRVLSGFVHSKPWVLVSAEQSIPGGPSMRVAQPQLEGRILAGVLNAVLDVHDPNLENWLVLAGYPTDIWSEAKKGAGLR